MICVDQNGQAVEISVADQMWLDDAYFNEKQMRLEPNAPRAALAYRVSTKGQVDHDDIPMQKIDCRKFAQKQGWRVVKEVAEKGVSGSKVSASKRDAIQQLKEEAANGEFDILLVYMFDRLGRIESETPFVLEWFVQNGIEMWSTHEGQQKIETHGDKLMNYIRFWQAAGESEKTSIRTATESDKSFPAVTMPVALYVTATSWKTKAGATSETSRSWTWSSTKKRLLGCGNCSIRLSEREPADTRWPRC